MQKILMLILIINLGSVGFPSSAKTFLDNCPFANDCVGEVSDFGAIYWESVTCDGVKADLMVNHRTVAVPTLFMDNYAIEMAPGPSYRGPVCLFYRGNYYVAFSESVGNAYEIYRIVKERLKNLGVLA